MRNGDMVVAVDNFMSFRARRWSKIDAALPLSYSCFPLPLPLPFRLPLGIYGCPSPPLHPDLCIPLATVFHSVAPCPRPVPALASSPRRAYPTGQGCTFSAAAPKFNQILFAFALLPLHTANTPLVLPREPPKHKPNPFSIPLLQHSPSLPAPLHRPGSFF